MLSERIDHWHQRPNGLAILVCSSIWRMGYTSVYSGEPLLLKRISAIKPLHPSLDGQDSAALLTEAQILASLAHPQIIRVHDFTIEQRTPLPAMDYAPGGLCVLCLPLTSHVRSIYCTPSSSYSPRCCNTPLIAALFSSLSSRKISCSMISNRSNGATSSWICSHPLWNNCRPGNSLVPSFPCPPNNCMLSPASPPTRQDILSRERSISDFRVCNGHHGRTRSNVSRTFLIR